MFLVKQSSVEGNYFFFVYICSNCGMDIEIKQKVLFFCRKLSKMKPSEKVIKSADATLCNIAHRYCVGVSVF
jgi:hypothetical protein